MDVGVPVERMAGENRVGLTPQGVRLLAPNHRCYVETGAGKGAGFQDEDYARAGAIVVYSPAEIYGRADLIFKFGATTLDELDLLHEGQTIFGFWAMFARPHKVVEALLEKHITVVAYELIRRDDGVRPVLYPLSEIAGRMTPQIAARWLQNDSGGSGILIGGVVGVPPSEICVLGAGVAGTNAARSFLDVGARVDVLDHDLERLRHIENALQGRVTTMMAYDFNLARTLKRARVLVTAIQAPGRRTPVLVTREMVRSMHPRSVIIDLSIDQGGCVETSRPTTHADPVFIEEKVIHYCVPNVPSVVARTATHAFLNGAWPYGEIIARDGLEAALATSTELQRGIVIQSGRITNADLAEVFPDLPH